MTLECLWALHESQYVNEARAEVIVVDDASPDDLRSKLTALRGLRVVGLDTNVGFLRAANAGVAAARGRHVHMLNNDTLPQGRWLDPLVERLEGRGALAVGSRLVYEDGTVQEAGGIIFADASGWNYGRGGRPDNPAVGYARRVDYCSAASLLVDGEFLRGRGGFDERYVPAYYEDTDLCFAAREAGGEVWYEPRSIVVHLEGQSHGTDTSEGLKRHQVINRDVFRERHAAALKQQRPPGEQSVGVARERVRSRIVVVDNEVPTADRDSGSLRLTSVMRGLVDDGFGVTFLPVNGWRRQPYARRLEDLGIEVLGTQDRWWPHLAEIAPSVSHVWLSRPEVASAFIAPFREALPDATVVYDTVDLHFLRQARGASVLSDPAVAEQARQMRELEVSLMRAADRVVVVSPVEQELLRREEGIESWIVPNVHEPVPGLRMPGGRDGLLFVGNFRHPPNADAVHWLIDEVMPLVWQECPELRVRVVGPDVPADVEALGEDPRVEVLGWVPDLSPLYAGARAVVAPLRFGAGLKGKVGEALLHGVPSVLTTTAAEGTAIVDGEHALVTDDVKDFARAIEALVDDDELWLRLSAHGRALIEREYSPSSVRRQVLGVVGVDGVATPGDDVPVPEVASPEDRLLQLEPEVAALRRQVMLRDEATAVLSAEVERLRGRAFVGSRPSATTGTAQEAVGRAAPAAASLQRILERALDEAQQARQARSGRSYRVVEALRSALARLRPAPPAAPGEDPARLAALALSGLVDAEWYYENYPDVAIEGVEPFEHFVTRGWLEGRSPGPEFDTEWYLATYPDVRDLTINPAIHYVVWGWAEGRLPRSSATPLPPLEPVAAEPEQAPVAAHVRMLHLNGYRCAGSTVRWVLERNYPGELLYVESEKPGERLRWQRLVEEVDLRDTRAITSHLVTVPDPGSGLADMVIGFVREPLARLYAAYIDEQSRSAARAPGETFDEFLARITHSAEANFQTRQFSPQFFGVVDEHPGWELRPGQIDLARPDLFVGVVERFDESMVVLEHLMAQRGLPFDGACPRLPDASLAPAPVEPSISTRVLEVDRALYVRVNQRLTELVQQLPDEGVPALEDYRQRCRSLRARPPAIPVLDPSEWLLLP